VLCFYGLWRRVVLLVITNVSGKASPHLQGFILERETVCCSTPKMESLASYESFVITYKTTRFHNTEGNTLRIL
jgi:hypothetical protein